MSNSKLGGKRMPYSQDNMTIHNADCMEVMKG